MVLKIEVSLWPIFDFRYYVFLPPENTGAEFGGGFEASE